MASFTSNTPQSSEFPSTSQPLMLSNNQYLAVFGAKDHKFTTNSTDADCGTHKQVTLTDQASSPGIPAGTNCVMYSKVANGESNLFFNNAGIDAQLTTFKASVPNNATVGCSCLPGGLLIQWGTGTYSNGSVVTFHTAFSAVYSVVANLADANSRGFVSIEAQSSANFTFVLKNAADSAPLTNRPVNWVAIGSA